MVTSATKPVNSIGLRVLFFYMLRFLLPVLPGFYEFLLPGCNRVKMAMVKNASSDARLLPGFFKGL